MQKWKALPRLGFGLGISVNHKGGIIVADILNQRGGIKLDYLEIYAGVRPIPVDALRQLHAWQDAGQQFTFHTASLDLWNLDSPDESGVAPTRAVEDFLQPHWCNQDLMLTRMQGLREGVLLTGVFSEEAALGFARRYRDVSKKLSTPLLIENAPYRLVLGDLDFGRFFSLFGEAADCGLTLDLGHLYSTSLLMRKSIDQLLKDYPLDRVVEIHIAGGYVDPESGLYVDNHDLDITSDVRELLRQLIGICPALKGVTYEVQDPDPDQLLNNISSVIETIDGWRYQTGCRAPLEMPG
ncbi:MAG: DUF692 family multinuclear iron-containing protein [Arenicellales bacterium]